jgi:hypothetical protein
MTAAGGRTRGPWLSVWSPARWAERQFRRRRTGVTATGLSTLYASHGSVRIVARGRDLTSRAPLPRRPGTRLMGEVIHLVRPTSLPRPRRVGQAGVAGGLRPSPAGRRPPCAWARPRRPRRQPRGRLADRRGAVALDRPVVRCRTGSAQIVVLRAAGAVSASVGPDEASRSSEAVANEKVVERDGPFASPTRTRLSPTNNYLSTVVRCAPVGLSVLRDPPSGSEGVVYIPMVIQTKRTLMGAAQNASYDDFDASGHSDADYEPVRREFHPYRDGGAAPNGDEQPNVGRRERSRTWAPWTT